MGCRMKIRTYLIWALCAFPGGALAAQETKACNVKTFAMVFLEVDKAPNETRELAIAELKKARAKMAEDDDVACSIHLANASDMVAAK